MTVVTLNGEPRELGEAATVEAAVRAAGHGRMRAALRSRSTARWFRAASGRPPRCATGQQVEVLHAVQGGA